MSVEQQAFASAQKTIQSCREISLDTIDRSLRIVSDHTFLDEYGKPGVCMNRKFISIEQMQDFLDKSNLVGTKVYVYKLYELTEYGRDLQPTGTFYHLRCCLRG